MRFDRKNQSLKEKRQTFGRYYDDKNKPAVLSADCAQDHEKFLFSTSCLVNAVVSVCAKDPVSWSKRDIHHILQAGFEYYGEIVRARYDSNYQTYLDLEDLRRLDFIEVGGRGVQCTIDPWSYSGDTKNPNDKGERICISVRQALERVVLSKCRARVIIDEMWISVAVENLDAS